MSNCAAPIIEIRPKRWQPLVVLPFIALLVGVFYWFILGPGVDTDNPPGTDFKIATVLVMAVGAFLFIYFLRMAITPKTMFRVDEDGIMMDTGVRTMVNWEEVDKVTLKTIRSTSNVGPQNETIVAVYLRDPAAYRNRYNFVLRNLVKLNESINGPSVMIPFVYVKKDYEAFRELAQRKTLQDIREEGLGVN